VYGRGYLVQSFELEDESDRRVITLHLNRGVDALVPPLSDLGFVKAVRWRK
jgi:hypothetical protein